jgi:hypothetical protein
MPTHECLGPDDRENLQDRRKPAIQLDKEPAIMVRESDATMQPTPQENQLMSKHRVLSFKPQLRLEWRGQDGQNETEQPDHSASLSDSITASTQIRFSVHTGGTYTIQPDHIEVGSLIGLAAVTRSPLRIVRAGVEHLRSIRMGFERLGIVCGVERDDLVVPTGQAMKIQDDFGGHVPKLEDQPWPALEHKDNKSRVRSARIIHLPQALLLPERAGAQAGHAGSRIGITERPHENQTLTGFRR